MLSAEFLIDPAHASLTGHFVNNPITPGVVTLDCVAQGLLEQIPETRLDGFTQVKFMNPLKANVVAVVTYQLKSDMLYHFNCEAGGDVILSGHMRIARKKSD